MITDDKVLEIEHYCQEHNVSRISRLKELGIPKGTAMLIQGSMTPEQLREIMSIL